VNRRALCPALLVFLATLSPLLSQSSPVVSITATRLSDSPLLSSTRGTFFDAGAFNPAAVRDPVNKAVTLFFRGQNSQGLSQIGRATSADGVHFTADKTAALAPQGSTEMPGGIEDPRLVHIHNLYYLTYTAYNGHDAQLALATSRDLIHWKRRGILLPAYRGTWNKQWTKSGAIVREKINGRWWMYYLGTRPLPDGSPAADDHGGRTIDYMGIASSTDLIHWKDATPEPVLPRRPDAFDSRVMEPGPPPIVTPAGILLLYNGADAHLIYRTGWALFDLHDPTRLIARSDAPFFQPELPWEKSGQVPNVVFLEGLVPDFAVLEDPRHPSLCSTSGRDYSGYYGAADKYIGGVRLHITFTCPKSH
jgi:predicted GH43/DUF377 family glycosyl hydrolase